MRRGFTNEFAQLLHANSRFTGTARLRGRVEQVGSYTGAVLSDEPDEWIPGELFELENPDILAKLDRYEGAEYARKVVTVLLDDGRKLETWVYVYNPRAGKSLADGSVKKTVLSNRSLAVAAR